MPKIKNNLTTTLGEINIPTLVQYTTENYRPYDPGQYLYRLVTRFSNEKKFSDNFIEFTYMTLIAWNMNQRSAKLSDFSVFKNSLLQHRQTIQSLEKLRIENLTDSKTVFNKIKLLFENLQLVANEKPKLVTFSKTLHYFLPNLLMPIDRSYTIKFFYNNTYVPNNDEKQFEMYWNIFKEFGELATIYNFDNYIDDNWNRNIPKIIDNIIIEYMQRKQKN